MLPEVEKTMRTTTVKSMQVSIKHKLMGVEADIRFVGEYPTTNSTGCDKGWFCPYLFASSRVPVIPRSRDWAIAQCFNPYLAGKLYSHLLAFSSSSISKQRMLTHKKQLIPLWLASFLPNYHLSSPCVTPILSRGCHIPASWSSSQESPLFAPTCGLAPAVPAAASSSFISSMAVSLSSCQLRPPRRPSWPGLLGRSTRCRTLARPDTHPGPSTSRLRTGLRI